MAKAVTYMMNETVKCFILWTQIKDCLWIFGYQSDDRTINTFYDMRNSYERKYKASFGNAFWNRTVFFIYFE